MKSRFTEQETELFYDTEDALYRSFWDKEGSLHWGIFDQSTGDDFLKACANLNVVMAEKASIDQSSRVLDLGCGNGTTSVWLSSRLGCRVMGVDLSGVRIANAKADLESQPNEVGAKVDFEKASATELPFDTGSFTHVWSQAAIYHVHDKEKALTEAYRVLALGGILVFDDLLKPKTNVSDTTRKYVYDRLVFDTDFSFETYQETLRKTGFEVVQAEDLSHHLKTSYQCLARKAHEKGERGIEKYQDLSYAYGKMVEAVDNQELGWGLYLCKK